MSTCVLINKNLATSRLKPAVHAADKLQLRGRAVTALKSWKKKKKGRHCAAVRQFELFIAAAACATNWNSAPLNDLNGHENPKCPKPPLTHGRDVWLIALSGRRAECQENGWGGGGWVTAAGLRLKRLRVIEERARSGMAAWCTVTLLLLLLLLTVRFVRGRRSATFNSRLELFWPWEEQTTNYRTIYYILIIICTVLFWFRFFDIYYLPSC